jgi:hypothetical protein
MAHCLKNLFNTFFSYTLCLKNNNVDDYYSFTIDSKCHVKCQSDKKFQKISIWVIFWNLSYDPPWTIPKTFPIIWSFLGICKNNYIISKFNYLIFVLLNYLISFLITISILIIISLFSRIVKDTTITHRLHYHLHQHSPLHHCLH